jgi:hypothetical protein
MSGADIDTRVSAEKPKRHRHEASMWFIAGGAWAWCYQCGAIRPSGDGAKWQRTSGIGGPNPATLKGWKE